MAWVHPTDRIMFEDDIIPSVGALKCHWKRSCLVLHMWRQVTQNRMLLPPPAGNGCMKKEGKFLIDWDSKESMQAVRQRVDLLLNMEYHLFQYCHNIFLRHLCTLIISNALYFIIHTRKLISTRHNFSFIRKNITSATLLFTRLLICNAGHSVPKHHQCVLTGVKSTPPFTGSASIAHASLG